MTGVTLSLAILKAEALNVLSRPAGNLLTSTTSFSPTKNPTKVRFRRQQIHMETPIPPNLRQSTKCLRKKLFSQLKEAKASSTVSLITRKI